MEIKDFYLKNGEKPLDFLVNDGGFCGILRSIACIGDSLSSGEFEAVDEKGNRTYHDMFDYSWGQYLARMAGCTVLNFSRGGMTAMEYCESFAEEKGFWSSDKACNAYIIALGVNDLYYRHLSFGTLADMERSDWTNTEKTFIAYYTEIVKRLRLNRPDARFFFMTMPREKLDDERENAANAHAAFLYELAARTPHAYVLDFRRYAPIYDEEFRRHFFLSGHMTPTGYLLTAKMVASYIDYLIRQNPADFKQVGFIGTPFQNREDS